MIKLETAKKLKNLGLEWEQVFGDWFWCDRNNRIFLKSSLGLNSKDGDETYMPNLGQLLTEIENQGWKWQMRALTMPEYCIQLRSKNILNGLIWGDGFYADSPEEATAQALIWVYNQKEDKIIERTQRHLKN